MRLRMVMLTAVVCAGSWVAAGGQVSGETVPHPCALNNGVYTCSWSAFEDTLAAAKTVSVQSDPMDERTNHALKRLARKLGKTVVETGDGPADLQFLLVPLNKDGVYVGPADVALATLRSTQTVHRRIEGRWCGRRRIAARRTYRGLRWCITRSTSLRSALACARIRANHVRA